MYTTATLRPETTENVRSSKRIYLEHKESIDRITSSITPIQSSTQTVEAAIYYTNVPLDGKSQRDMNTAREISITVAKRLLLQYAVSTIDIHTKVREKDKAILSTFTFSIPETTEDIPAVEKNIWHPLKMETLRALLAHPEIGAFVPVNDKQLSQLGEYLDSI